MAGRRVQALRIALLGAIAPILMFGYATARPSIESLFLAQYTRDGLPLAWACVAAASALVAVGWGRVAGRRELGGLMAACAGLSALALAALLGAHHLGLPGAVLLLYVWKDVYIIVMVESFYAFANQVFPLATARWVYGLMGLLASVGSLLGNLCVGPLAAEVGTARAPWLVVPGLLAVGLLALTLGRRAGTPVEARAVVQPLGALLGTVRRSAYLPLTVLLVATVQVVVNLVDFGFAGALEQHYPDVDARTAVVGRVYAAVDVVSMLMQATTGPALRMLGVGGTLLVVPVGLGLSLLAALVSPAFGAMAALKVLSKALDYSWGRAAKEATYLPLRPMERTAGKAIADVMGYRVAKGVASLLVLGLVSVGLQGAALGLAGVGIGGWIAVSRALGRRYLGAVHAR